MIKCTASGEKRMVHVRERDDKERMMPVMSGRSSPSGGTTGEESGGCESALGLHSRCRRAMFAMPVLNLMLPKLPAAWR